MKLYTRINLLLLTLLIISSGYSIKAQTAINYADDPIAAALDSLWQLNIFEKNTTKRFAKKGNYNFAPDSVPVYDDATLATRLSKLDAQSPFDLVYNPKVKAYIDMYTVRKRELVSRLMGISQLYFPLFEQELDKRNMPLELKYLAVIESALNPCIRSRAGAVGLWQFMYGTGKMYNLKITSYVDDRCDPIKATKAACEYLQFLYDTFGDWQMALAAYNCGPGNINKAIRRSGGKKTYWEIRPYLPVETQGYVPSFIAVNYVMNYAAEHNMYESVPKKTFYQVDTVIVKQQLSFQQIAKVLDIPIEDLEYLNPSYRRNIVPYNGHEPSVLVLPINKIGAFVSNENAIYDELKKDSSQVFVYRDVAKIHTVRSGERINNIANRYKCSVADIMTWNNLRSYKLKPKQALTIYIPVKGTAPAATGSSIASKTLLQPKAERVESTNKPENVAVASTTATTENSSAKRAKIHTIRSGDTLWKIATAYGATVDQLKTWNKLGSKYMLSPGQKLKVGFEG